MKPANLRLPGHRTRRDDQRLSSLSLSASHNFTLARQRWPKDGLELSPKSTISQDYSQEQDVHRRRLCALAVDPGPGGYCSKRSFPQEDEEEDKDAESKRARLKSADEGPKSAGTILNDQLREKIALRKQRGDLPVPMDSWAESCFIESVESGEMSLYFEYMASHHTPGKPWLPGRGTEVGDRGATTGASATLKSGGYVNVASLIQRYWED